MGDASELGAFLKARRAALDPSDLGLPAGVNQRRVAGLRREELAQLAGISVDYYTRLEQGRARNVSDSVLSALARSLRLDGDEETYLRNLAAPERRDLATLKPQQVRPQLQALLDAMNMPAVVFGRYLDVLAWNRLGGALSFALDTIAPAERNMARLFFLDDTTARGLHPEWDEVSKEVVANLRSETGRYPGDPKLAALIDELSARSEPFRRLWADHHVREKTHGIKIIRNPVVGELTLWYETLRFPDEPDQAMVTYHAEPGSATARALGLLASWVTDPEHQTPAGDRIR
jgi:transcriptional regulator with XRE-family HTH domain